MPHDWSDSFNAAIKLVMPGSDWQRSGDCIWLSAVIDR
jgi:hypothetical protein